MTPAEWRYPIPGLIQARHVLARMHQPWLVNAVDAAIAELTGLTSEEEMTWKH